MRRWKTSDISRRSVLELIERPMDHRYPAINTLASKTGAPEKVALAALEREERAGNIDFGVSINWPWLTDRGKLELSRLRGQ